MSPQGPCRFLGNSWVTACYPLFSSHARFEIERFYSEVRTGFEPAYNGFANRCLPIAAVADRPHFVPFPLLVRFFQTAVTRHYRTRSATKMGNSWATKEGRTFGLVFGNPSRRLECNLDGNLIGAHQNPHQGSARLGANQFCSAWSVAPGQVPEPRANLRATDRFAVSYYLWTEMSVDFVMLPLG